MGRLATADWSVTAGSGLTGYLWQIQRFPMLEPHEEYVLAKRWREHSDHEAAHKLVNSHLRLVAKIARRYRGYGLPISDVISEGNVGLMQAVQRFKPEKGFRFATYAAWWIRAAIQEYILRSWSLVRMATTANRRKLFFNLRKAKSKISVIDEGDMRHDQIETIAKRLGVTKQDVIDMNGGLAATPRSTRRSARTAIPANGRTGWLMKVPARRLRSPRVTNTTTAARRSRRRSACSTIASDASSKRDGSPRTQSRLRTWPPNSASRPSASVRSTCVRSRRYRRR